MKRNSARRKARKSAAGPVAGLIVVAAVIVGAYYGLTHLKLKPIGVAGTSLYETHCKWNLERLNMAMTAYTNDHDNTLPEAARWREQLKPYLEQVQYSPNGRSVLKCEADNSSAACSYAMNSNISGKNAGDLSRRTVIFYETSHPGDCPSGTGTDVADPPRHPGGNFYAFVGGAVKQSATKPAF
jgi:hypothetical protein